VILPPGVNGDYNNNGIVDAADYVLWRSHLGQNFALPNDTTPGTVMQVDYTVWRNNFGASASGNGALVSGAEVPEPSSFMLLLIAISFLSRGRRLGRGI
jgi:hypothetical protein